MRRVPLQQRARRQMCTHTHTTTAHGCLRCTTAAPEPSRTSRLPSNRGHASNGLFLPSLACVLRLQRWTGLGALHAWIQSGQRPGSWSRAEAPVSAVRLVEGVA